MHKQLLIYYHVSNFEKNRVHQISKIVNIFFFLNESFYNSFRPSITIFVSANSSILLKYKIWKRVGWTLSLSLSLSQQESSQEFKQIFNWGKKKKMYFFFFFFCDCKLSEVIYWRGWSVAASFPSKIVMRGRWLLYTYHVLNNGLKQIENMKKKN